MSKKWDLKLSLEAGIIKITDERIVQPNSRISAIILQIRRAENYRVRSGIVQTSAIATRSCKFTVHSGSTRAYLRRRLRVHAQVRARPEVHVRFHS